MTTLYFRSAITEGQCGIGRLHNIDSLESFQEKYGPHYTHDEIKKIRYTLSDKPLTMGIHKGGCGFFGTGFINEKRCKSSYEQLAKTHHLVFQTPVRKNKNSGEMFFYAMFDDTKQNDVSYIQPKWPFEEESV